MVPPVLWMCFKFGASCFDIAWPCFVYCFSTPFQKTKGEKTKTFLGLFRQSLLFKLFISKYGWSKREKGSLARLKNLTKNPIKDLFLEWLDLVPLVSILYLQCVLVVVQTIDPDVIVQSCAGDRSKKRQFEPFGSCLADWLAHQAVSPQCLC